MELTTVKTTELTNKELAKSLNTINGLVCDLKNNKKLIAFNIGTIINDEMWVDDFKDTKTFFKFLNISKATASQFKKLASVVDVQVVNSDFSYSQIAETYPLLDLMDTIRMQYLNDLEITSDMTCSEIRKKVKSIIDSQIVDEPTEGETTEETETSGETTESDIDYLINYLENLEAGIELDNEDIKVFKQIVRELKKHE